MYRHDPERTLETAETTIRVSIDAGYNHWLAEGTIVKGWALAKQGHVREGKTCMNKGMEKWRSIGTLMSLPTYMALFAEVHIDANQLKEALACCEEGLAISANCHDRVSAAELHPLKGEALIGKRTLQATREASAKTETCFRHAIEIARRQQAKSFEHRATMSLARLWQETGKAREAKRILAKIYRWFTEGFDTPDLKAAKE